MKTTKRFILAFLSTFLLAIGLVRAADKLDPVTRDLTDTNNGEVIGSAVDCGNLCHIIENDK